MSADYTDRQNARDREYKDAWAKLSPKQRQQLQKAGIKGPEMPKYRTHRPEMPDVEKMAQRAVLHENGYPCMPEQVKEPLRASGELLKAFLFRIVDEGRNPRLEAECISLAFGFGAALGLSQTEVAKRYGLTRAAVSKRVREIQQQFNLPASEFMKSDRAREVYRLTNKPRL